MNPKIKYLLITLAVVILLSQLQPLFLNSVGAVDGSFGVRPMTHKCLGLAMNPGGTASHLPTGQTEFFLGMFHFRYVFNDDIRATQRPICIGQDVWFGE